MSLKNYYSQPSIYSIPTKDGSLQGTVAFISDDDLWTVPLAGGQARRLTANLGVVSDPVISPDGGWIAFVGTESGQRDIYLISVNGGEFRRLTYFGVGRINGWKDDHTLIFNSTHESPNARISYVYLFDLENLEAEKLPYGPATDLSYGSGGRMLIGRHCRDSAQWKRYRGGTAGVIWVSEGTGANGNGRAGGPPRKFTRILKNIEYSLTHPQWIGERIYFISDFEGIGRVYRTDARGRKPERLSENKEFYARKLRTDGRMLVWQAGGDIYVGDLEGKCFKLEIELATPAIQAQPRFDSALDYLEDVAVHPKGEEIALVSRGHLFRMKPWSEGVVEHAGQDPVRFKLPLYIEGGRKVIFVKSDHVEDESLHVAERGSERSQNLFPNQRWGKIWSVCKNPVKDEIVLCNNRNQIFLLDIEKKKFVEVERGLYGRMSEATFSPDGRYLVYTSYFTSERTGLRIYDLKSKTVRWLIDPVLSDWSGSFDLSGEYFYFLSVREFHPTYNATHFDLGFPFAGRPFVISLKRDSLSPFAERPSEDKKKDKARTGTKKSAGERDDKAPPETRIDWDGLEQRIESIPVRFGGYHSLVGLERKILFKRERVGPSPSSRREPEQKPELFTFSFDRQKEEFFHGNIQSYQLTEDRSQMLLLTRGRLRLIGTKDVPRDGGGYDRFDGWIDGGRARLRVHPRSEWRQMYREAWELQKEHFWDENLSKVDWELVFARYLPLLARVQTRSELSDVLWEMQGELGTSHTYEYMGDYFRQPPSNPVGYLGGEFSFVSDKKGFLIERLYAGDAWVEGRSSPLLGPKAGLKKGDLILGIDGWRLISPEDLGRRLLNKAGVEVNLEIQRKGSNRTEMIPVRTLRSQVPVLYREWVERNRAYVHEKSKGKIGYVHVPDMMANGYAEFYRGFLAEHTKEGLIVDVRNNGGGHVSQHILKILAQKLIGFDLSRWNGVFKYPGYAINGPVVAVTNELAGSDGDIFSHSFKLMKIGPLIGKRTWGGVIGINGQYSLRDGTTTTQPEYSFWFTDVGWAVENYGTKPDIEVEFPPEAWAAGQDPQLDRAIEEVQRLSRKTPPVRPDLRKRPDLSLPR